MWHLLMAHQLESFHPFSPARSLLLPKPHGKREHPKAAQSQLSPKPCGAKKTSRPAAPIALYSPISDSSYNQLHLPAFPILPTLLGCHSYSGQVWPHDVEPIICKLSCSCCNQRVASQLHLGLKSLPFPRLKAGPQLFNISMKPVKRYRYVK